MITEVSGGYYAMERIVRQTMLYDFYGELLTEHQRNAYEEVVMNDLSYAELARLEGISRQGAYDMIRRCDRQLEEYEEKLHLVERFVDIRSKIRRISALADDAGIREITAICTEVLEEL